MSIRGNDLLYDEHKLRYFDLLIYQRCVQIFFIKFYQQTTGEDDARNAEKWEVVLALG